MKIIALILLSFVVSCIITVFTTEADNEHDFNDVMLGGFIILSASSVGIYLLFFK